MAAAARRRIQATGTVEENNFKGSKTHVLMTPAQPNSCPSGRIHAREWSCDKTVAGMESHSRLVYQTFRPLAVGVTDGSIHRAMGGLCTGYKDKTKLPHKMLVPPGHFENTILIFVGQSAITP